jgi:hypothetical protein
MAKLSQTSADFVLNGVKNDKKAFKQMIRCINDINWLQAMGGALFNAGVLNQVVHLNLAPAIIEGKRNHHYDMPLDPAIAQVIVGMIDVNGDYRLLVRLESMEISDQVRSAYRNCFIDFARFMHANGVKGKGSFDTVTEMALKELKLFDQEPKSLQELADLTI